MGWGWAAAALAAAAYVAAKLMEVLWWRPRRVEEHFARQGIRGPRYRFFVGCVREMVALMVAASAAPMPRPYRSHNVLPRVLAFYHHWRKIYARLGGQGLFPYLPPRTPRDMKVKPTPVCLLPPSRPVPPAAVPIAFTPAPGRRPPPAGGRDMSPAASPPVVVVPAHRSPRRCRHLLAPLSSLLVSCCHPVGQQRVQCNAAGVYRVWWCRTCSAAARTNAAGRHLALPPWRLVGCLLTWCSTFLIWFGPTPRLAVADPDLIREILLSRAEHFDRYESHPMVRQLEGEGLVSLRGEKWAHRRRVLTPAFRMENLKLLLPFVGRTVVDMVDKWRDMAAAGSGEVEIDVSEWFQVVTEDAITRTAFGRSYEDGKAVFKLQTQLMAFASEAFRKVFIPGYR
ncbi:hypothetical protein C2845_PM07G00510 [Panicum miliaceum]|uniref:Uncharacterized protein n=1 Tax=Panicum miliaceum TaxID=4540 RepID=A0A3L6SUP0_PANMI|nr:hypothetical protein C2845_PM07G00510 [Panicum miliaceum]